MDLTHLPTPAALIDRAQMQRNIQHMQQRMDALGVRFRPHVKTSKCWPVVQAQMPLTQPLVGPVPVRVQSLGVAVPPWSLVTVLINVK